MMSEWGVSRGLNGWLSRSAGSGRTCGFFLGRTRRGCHEELRREVEQHAALLCYSNRDRITLLSVGLDVAADHSCTDTVADLSFGARVPQDRFIFHAD